MNNLSFSFSDPCFAKPCDTFSQCVAKADDSTVCECRTRCSDLKQLYFCGTDGRSYKYPCGDRLKKCPTVPGVGWRHSEMCGKNLCDFSSILEKTLVSFGGLVEQDILVPHKC